VRWMAEPRTFKAGLCFWRGIVSQRLWAWKTLTCPDGPAAVDSDSAAGAQGLRWLKSGIWTEKTIQHTPWSREGAIRGEKRAGDEHREIHKSSHVAYLLSLVRG
jgi:hypothetical protein